MWETVLFILACLGLPILWGVLVDWVFNHWNLRNGRIDETDEESSFPDYQI